MNEQVKFELVPTEPISEQVDEGAQSIVSREDGCKWPDSWDDYQVARARNDARKSYRAMVATAPYVSENEIKAQALEEFAQEMASNAKAATSQENEQFFIDCAEQANEAAESLRAKTGEQP